MKAKKILTPAVIARFARLGAGYIRLVGSSSRWEIRGADPVWALWKEGRSLIFAFWHNRFLVMPYLYTRYFKRKRVAVIVSQSRDGALVGELISNFGFRPVRGSTTRGGKAALLGLAREIRAGWDAAVTPDGPQGPRYEAQPGIISLACTTGAPIIPLSYASSRRIILNRTWDQMRIPLPLGRITVVCAPPLEVAAGTEGERRLTLARELQERLQQADREAEAGWG